MHSRSVFFPNRHPSPRARLAGRPRFARISRFTAGGWDVIGLTRWRSCVEAPAVCDSSILPFTVVVKLGNRARPPWYDQE